MNILPNRVRRIWSTVALAACLGFTCGPAITPHAHAQSQADKQRVIEGTVRDSAGQPVSGAIVYMKNAGSLTVKTYVTNADGAFRFGQVAMDADYQIYAEMNGRKSQTKSISNFDSKKLWSIALKLDR